ncbi:MAG: rhodanese-like domain-containing protein [bacterium]
MTRSLGEPSGEYISAQTLRAMLQDGIEIALLDVRELRDFSIGHLWLASHLPLSRLELRVRRFVPRPGTRIVLCDQANGVAERAASKLQDMGYCQLQILEGGINAWTEAGFELVGGNYVIAHAFGYHIEDQYQTPVMTAQQLHTMRDNGEEVLVIDARSENDYLEESIPGSISVPAAEVARKISDLVPNSSIPIVVHCAGITRAMLGAQGLINCEIPNPVFSLRDGTRGWVLDGGELIPNQRINPVVPSAAAKKYSTAAAARLAAEFSLTYVTLDQMLEWRTDHPDRTCYLIDVRSEQEYLVAHYPESISIPGGELAGMTIDHLATQNARLCLFADEDCARSEITASWMKQLGWSDVVIVRGWQSAPHLLSGAEPDCYPEIDALDVTVVSAESLVTDNLTEQVEILDFSQSEHYRQGHIPGAVWASRAQLGKDIALSTGTTVVICTSRSGRQGRLAAADLDQLIGLPVKAVEGGNLACFDAGVKREAGQCKHIGQIDDIDEYLSPPSNDGRGELLSWHRHCISWRNRLYGQFRQQQPVNFGPDSNIQSNAR